MTTKESFRQINDIEKRIINNSLSKLSIKSIEDLYGTENIACVKININQQQRDFPKIFLTPIDLRKITEKFSSNLNIISSGLYLGFIKESIFNFSIEGVEYLYKHNKFPFTQIFQVNEKTEKSILYGNHIKKESLINPNTSVKKGDLILFLNKDNDVIALGRSIIDFGDYETIGLKEKIAQNLVDKGYYLRKE